MTTPSKNGADQNELINVWKNEAGSSSLPWCKIQIDQGPQLEM